MPVLLVLLFIIVPLVEILVILQVGAVLGAWWTVGLLVADSILGAWLLRVEGARAWAEFRRALTDGRWPGDEVAQGALVIVGGTLLLTPGFVTDVVGFLLLLAPTRRMVAGVLRRRVAAGLGLPGSDPRRRSSPTSSSGASSGASSAADLEVEVVEIERDPGPEPDPDPGPDTYPDHGR
jgi:UPF0716 protein FxsA